MNQIIKDRNGGTVGINEIYSYCDKAGFKHTNAERRLRHSESPNIDPVYNDKKTAIIGYRWKQAPVYEIPSKSNPEQPHYVVDIGTSLACDCFHFNTFGYCSHQKEAQKKQLSLV